MKAIDRMKTHAAHFCALAILLPGLWAQTQPAANPGTENDTPEPKRQSLGFRVLAMPYGPLGLMAHRTYGTTLTNNGVAYDWQFNTTPRRTIPGIGLSFEYKLGRRSTITGDLLYHRLNYDAVTDIYSGVDDPTTATDERSRITRTERTEARVWTLPVLFHWNAFRSPGITSKLYLAGGAAYSLVTNVRTQNSFTFADGTTSSNSDPARPSHRQTAGGVVGIGFRFVDDYNIKVTPEVRYTRWMHSLFDSEATKSPRNQIEVGFGMTF